jgi:hypothetical protein
MAQMAQMTDLNGILIGNILNKPVIKFVFKFLQAIFSIYTKATEITTKFFQNSYKISDT